MADILYTFENSVYLNITNTCPCKCKFCIRNNGDSVGDASTLWFEGHAPSFDEIKSAIDAFDFSDYKGEIIFCGYGEPTAAYKNFVMTCSYIKEKLGLPIRLNTNGLSDLLNGKPTAEEICSLVDTVSISLNQHTAEKYNELCVPAFGEKAFDAMLKFAKECKTCDNVKVVLSVVDVIPAEDIEECKKLADEMGIPLRVRKYTD
ncbi:MAG: TIGR04100 family radical SAM protein [Clostridia bacterium]|nr:TIGR04100 family radical SAM protein [Clostridia bacterium]